MQLQSRPTSAIEIAIVASSIGGIGRHEHNVVGSVDSIQLQLQGPGPWTLQFSATIDPQSLAPQSADLNRIERTMFLRQLRHRDILNAKKFKQIKFTGTFSGDTDSGDLQGDIMFRDATYPIQLPLQIESLKDGYVVSATWCTQLTALNIQPPTVLGGAFKVDDDIVIKLRVEFASV